MAWQAVDDVTGSRWGGRQSMSWRAADDAGGQHPSGPTTVHCTPARSTMRFTIFCEGMESSAYRMFIPRKTSCKGHTLVHV
jgi:hypothetical protein